MKDIIDEEGYVIFDNKLFMDSFNDMFDPKPLIREGFVYFNTEFGMLKLTEEQLESISYLL